MDNLGINTRTYSDKELTHLTKIGYVGTRTEIDAYRNEMAEKLSGSGENEKQINTTEEEFMEAFSKLTPQQQELVNNTNLTGAEADSFRDGAYRSFSDEDFANIRNAMELKSNITAQGLSDNAQIVPDENGNTSGFIIESDNIGLSDDVIRKAVIGTLNKIVDAENNAAPTPGNENAEKTSNSTENIETPPATEPRTAAQNNPQTPPTVPEQGSEVSTENKTPQNTTTVENNTTPQNVEQPPKTPVENNIPDENNPKPETKFETKYPDAKISEDGKTRVRPDGTHIGLNNDFEACSSPKEYLEHAKGNTYGQKLGNAKRAAQVMGYNLIPKILSGVKLPENGNVQIESLIKGLNYSRNGIETLITRLESNGVKLEPEQLDALRNNLTFTDDFE